MLLFKNQIELCRTIKQTNRCLKLLNAVFYYYFGLSSILMELEIQNDVVEDDALFQ